MPIFIAQQKAMKILYGVIKRKIHHDVHAGTFWLGKIFYAETSTFQTTVIYKLATANDFILTMNFDLVNI